MNLEDVAKLAGVSRSTVSRVVNDDPRVSVAVRARVRQIIGETSYHPNAAARSLASRRSRIIGLLIPQAMSQVFGDAWFPVIIQGCIDGCHGADFSLMLLMESSTDPVAASRVIERSLRSRHLDGLVISSTLNDDILSEELNRQGFPFVTIGRDNGRRHNFVDVDNELAAFEATSHLLTHGYRRLAMVAGPTSMVGAEDRRRGFLRALAEAGHCIETVPILHADFDERRAHAAALELLSSPDRPDAIFAASDVMARGVLRAAQSLGLHVPSDLAVIGFDGIQPDLLDSEGLSTMVQPAMRIGHRAVEILVSLINTPQSEPIQEWFPTELSLRTSCGCPAHALPRQHVLSAGAPVPAFSFQQGGLTS